MSSDQKPRPAAAKKAAKKDPPVPAKQPPPAKKTTQRTAAVPAKPTPPPVVAAPPKRLTPVESVAAKYRDAEWTVIVPPRGTINDLIASKGTALHYVQVATPDTFPDPKFHGEAKNQVIQNAFSNGAAPILALVTPTNGAAPKITFEDVNLLKSVIIGRKKPARAEPAAAEPQRPN